MLGTVWGRIAWGVGEFLCWGIVSVLGTLPSSCLPAGGFPNKEGPGGSVMGREGAGALLGQEASGSQCSSAGPVLPVVLLLLRQIQDSCSWVVTALSSFRTGCCWEPSACRIPVPAPLKLQHQPMGLNPCGGSSLVASTHCVWKRQTQGMTMGMCPL